MLQALPYVNNNTSFALKGGTAINYFYNDVPRISVDIDLVYLPLLDRQTTIQNINKGMINIAEDLRQKPWQVEIDKPVFEDTITKINVSQRHERIKLETNGIFRGTVLQPERRMLSSLAAEIHDVAPFDLLCASFEDIYAGKFCAALTRQHPRDLFDVAHFFNIHEITTSLSQAFVVYMCSDRRPFHEILLPRIKNQSLLFESEFKGMTHDELTYDSLSSIVKQLADTLIQQLSANEKTFILSMAEGEPDWSKMPMTHLQDMPSLKWKIMNVQQMDARKRKLAVQALKQVLGEDSLSRESIADSKLL